MARVFAVAALLATALLASTANAKAPNYFVAAEAPDYNNDAVAGLLTNVNSVRKPGTAYAVFDWDNSAMFGDVSATTMFYQVDNLNFRFSPDEFKSIFALGYDASSSDKCFPEGTNSVIGKDVNGAGVKFYTVLADAAKDYKVLYDAYIAPTYKLGGTTATASTSLADIKKTTEFLNFRAKLGFLLYSLQLMNGGDDHSECSLINAMVVYPRLFVGMTENEIKAFARESLRWNLAQSLESLSYTSTGTVAVKASYSKGLRVFGGQETTIRALCKAGVTVYVISGSPEILVAEAANLAGLGYLVPRTNVYGGRFTTDSKGLFTGELLANYPTTWGPGKATIVKNILMKKHKGAAPIYSTGDSDGDCEALNTVRDGIVHINNRLKENTTCIYGFYEKACHYFGTTEPATRNTYLLQGQDRAIGMWVNSGFTTKDGVDFKSGVSTNNGCAAYKFLNL